MAALRRPDGRRMLALAGWIALGAVVSAGIVFAAFLLRQHRESPAPAPSTTGVAAAASPQAVSAEAATVQSEALRGISIVRLRIGPELSAGRESKILTALNEAGITSVRVEELPFRVATSRVGYYRAEDLEAAEALGRVIAPVLTEAIGVRDYGKLLADPEPGRLDLWVGG